MKLHFRAVQRFVTYYQYPEEVMSHQIKGIVTMFAQKRTEKSMLLNLGIFL